MTPKRWAIAGGAALAALVLAFLAGRRSVPTKTAEHTKTTEEIEKEQKAITEAVARARSEWEKSVQDHTVKKTRTKYSPEGKPVEKEETTYVDRDTQAHGSMDATVVTSTVVEVRERVEKVTEATKTVETARPDWAVDVAAFWDPRRGTTPSAATAKLERRIIGPLWLGVGALGDNLTEKPRLLPGVGARLEW